MSIGTSLKKTILRCPLRIRYSVIRPGSLQVIRNNRRDRDVAVPLIDRDQGDVIPIQRGEDIKIVFVRYRVQNQAFNPVVQQAVDVVFFIVGVLAGIVYHKMVRRVFQCGQGTLG